MTDEVGGEEMGSKSCAFQLASANSGSPEASSAAGAMRCPLSAEQLDQLERVSEGCSIASLEPQYGAGREVGANLFALVAFARAAKQAGARRDRDWISMESAPRDGTVIDACCRYRDAMAGSPSYVFWMEGAWREPGRDLGEPMVCWAWRPRTGWPEEQPTTSPLGGDEQSASCEQGERTIPSENTHAE